VALLDDLGQDRDGDLGRAAGTDVEAGRAMELGAQLVGNVERGAHAVTAPPAGHEGDVGHALA